MYRKKIRNTLMILLSFVSFQIHAVSVTASLDSSQMFIGQQCKLHLTVVGPIDKKISLPTFPGDSIINNIEIVKYGKNDTIKDENSLTIKKDYTITSFQDSLYYIPPIKVVIGNDTILSDFNSIKIGTFKVDTVSKKIYDIKSIVSPKFVIWDYSNYFFIVVFLIVVFVLLFFYIKNRKHSEEEVEEYVDPEDLLPPHVVAIKYLDKLKSEKIWLLGEQKEYFTDLSNILKKYIKRRFNIDAMEMTSREILDLLKADSDISPVYKELKNVLELSDLVKFAKYKPDNDDSESSIILSYDIVNKTKIEENVIEEDNQEKDDNTIDQSVEQTNVDKHIDQEEELKKYQPK